MPPAFADTVARGGIEAVIFLGAQAELDALLAELANQVPVPRIYLLSSLMSRPLANLPACSTSACSLRTRR